MASAKTIEKRKAVLRARGVPEKFIDNIARRKGLSSRMALVLVLWLVFMALLMAPLFGLLAFSDQITAWLAPLIYPEARSSLLFWTSDDFSLVLCFAVVGALLIVAVTLLFRVVRKSVRPFPAFHMLAEHLRTLGAYETLETIPYEPRLAGLDTLADDTAFLQTARPVKRRTPIAFPLIMGGVFLLYAASHVVGAFDRKAVDLDAIRQSDLQGQTTHSFKTARYAYVTCYDNSGWSRFNYHIVFPDGSFSVWQWSDPVHGLTTAGVLDRVDRIDRRLSSLGIPVYRMPQTGSPAFDGSACVAKLSQEWGLKSPETLRRLVFG